MRSATLVHALSERDAFGLSSIPTTPIGIFLVLVVVVVVVVALEIRRRHPLVKWCCFISVSGWRSLCSCMHIISCLVFIARLISSFILFPFNDLTFSVEDNKIFFGRKSLLPVPSPVTSAFGDFSKLSFRYGVTFLTLYSL